MKYMSAGIETRARMEEGSTIYLDIRTATISNVVVEAIEKLGGFGARIVVGHNGLYTTDEDPKIDKKILDIVQTCAGQGIIWHPGKKQWVQAITKY